MNTRVLTKNGYVNGFSENGINKWFGIPYAKPPVKELRFKRAVPADNWDGELMCKKMSPKPWQFAGGKFEKLTRTDNEASEDCLYLNIWAPENIDNNARKPVLFWIYGGGQYAGEASAPEYYLDAFARDGVIGVSFNYRLGVLGFYDFSRFEASFESNCAISDMIMALKWVNENIAAFGGDPENVTIAGESAGATSSLALLASPYARPYFNKAIVMSGLLGNISSGTIQEVHREQFLEAVGISEEEIIKLRYMTYDELLPGCRVVFEGHTQGYPGLLSCGPVFDDLVPEELISVIERGELKDKKLMIGTCRDEGGLFNYMKICPRTWADILNMLKNNGYLGLRERFETFYGKMKIHDAVLKANRDRMFVTGSIKTAIAFSKNSDAYMYRFDLVTPISRLMRMGATHTMDVCPALDTNDGHMATMYKLANQQMVDYIHAQMHGAFMNFVISGNPNEGSAVLKKNTADNLYWPTFNEKDMDTFIFDEKCHVLKGPDRDNYELWKDIKIY